MKSKTKARKLSPIALVKKPVNKKHAKKRAQKRAIRQARPIHKKVILHPVSIMVLLCVGVFLSLWTYKAIADSYSVTASVMAAPLNSPSVITEPANNSTVYVPTVQLYGSCEYMSYIKLFRNGLFAGVAYCMPDGRFAIKTDLFLGINTLRVDAYNITDNQGPISAPMTIIYQKPVQSSAGYTLNPPADKPVDTGHETTAGILAANPPMLLTSDFHYDTFVTTSKFEWALDVEGGTPPYDIHVDWGDGTTSDFKFPIDPVFHISHTYKKSGYYPILVTSKDKYGQIRLMQLAALIHKPGSGEIIATTQKSDTPTSDLSFSSTLLNAKKWLLVAWPSFLVVFLMVMTFWLGERQEYQQIYMRVQPKKHVYSRRRSRSKSPRALAHKTRRR